MRACARSSSTRRGWRSSSPRRSATARATACAITYSFEGRDHGGALETAGGIAKALPLLGDAFWVVSGDVFVPDFRFDARPTRDASPTATRWASSGWSTTRRTIRTATSASTRTGWRAAPPTPKFTWASIGLFRAALFDDIVAGTKMALRPKLEGAIDQRRLRATKYAGHWTDVGTMERLAALQTGH